MKVVFFTDGSRPYGGFTASYTSSEDAGDVGCCKRTSSQSESLSASTTLPQAAKPSVLPAFCSTRATDMSEQKTCLGGGAGWRKQPL